MASRRTETTTRFRVDISELRAGIQAANRQIALAESEFRNASAGMDNWAQSADGLSAKITQLRTVTSQFENILGMLEQQYQAVVAREGENSRGATDLMVRMNNLRATITNNNAAIQRYENTLSQLQEETEDNSRHTGDLDRQMRESAEGAREAADGYSVMKGALANLAAEGIKKVIDILKEFTIGSDAAFQHFQAKTGKSTVEMQRFNSEIQDLYNNGFGESLEEAADAMAEVATQIKEADPERVRAIAENAMTLSDVFGMDLNENLRGANALMTSMGLTSEEAFDLIAKGAQNGLNKSGELTDNLAEYVALWGQAGFGAEEMFSILQNGLDAGAYNLDKVNDFVKEFSNSLSDGRIEENIKSFSEETGQLFTEWKEGKRTSKDVFYSVIRDLKNATSEQEALTTASTVWSALGEDNALNIIRSLTEVNDTYQNVAGTMDEIKKVKYDDVISQFKVLGRTIMSDIFTPLAEKALPKIKEFVTYAIENLDQIIPIIEGIGAAFAAIFVIGQISALTTAIMNLANPLGLILTSAAALTGILVAGESARKKYVEDTYGMTESQKELVQSTDEMTESYKNTMDAREKAVQGIQREYGYIEQLVDELDQLVDENGKIKEGYEDRVNFIAQELQEKTGLEIEITDQVVQKYGELRKEIEGVIRTKKAEALLAATNESYVEAVKSQTEAFMNYRKVAEEVKQTEEELAKVKEECSRAEEEVIKQTQNGATASRESVDNMRTLQDAVKETEEKYKKLSEKLNENEELYISYNTTIKNYEGLSQAIVSGEAEAIEEQMQKITYSFISAETGTKESLERQVTQMQETYEEMKRAVAEGAPGVTQENVDSMKNLVDLSMIELEVFKNKAPQITSDGMQLSAYAIQNETPLLSNVSRDASNAMNDGFGSADTQATGKKKAGQFIEGVNGQLPTILTKGTLVSNTINDGFGSADTQATGKKKAGQFIEGVDGQLPTVLNKGTLVSNTINDGFGSADTRGKGKQKTEEYASGVSDGSGTAQQAAFDVASGAAYGLSIASGDSYTTGQYFSQGFIDGITSMGAAVASAAAGVGKKAVDALKEKLDVHSPSRKTYETGDFFVLGFINAIQDNLKKVGRTVSKMADTAVKPLSDMDVSGLNYTIGASNKTQQIQAAAGRQQGNVVNQTYNQYNYSPKALSRIEIYRQTRNQILVSKGVG